MDSIKSILNSVFSQPEKKSISKNYNRQVQKKHNTIAKKSDRPTIKAETFILPAILVKNMNNKDACILALLYKISNSGTIPLRYNMATLASMFNVATSAMYAYILRLRKNGHILFNPTDKSYHIISPLMKEWDKHQKLPKRQRDKVIAAYVTIYVEDITIAFKARRSSKHINDEIFKMLAHIGIEEKKQARIDPRYLMEVSGCCFETAMRTIRRNTKHMLNSQLTGYRRQACEINKNTDMCKGDCTLCTLTAPHFKIIDRIRREGRYVVVVVRNSILKE